MVYIMTLVGCLIAEGGKPATLTCAPVSTTASSSGYVKLSGDFKLILRVGSLDLLFSLLQILVIFSTLLITNGDRSYCFD